VDVTGDLYLYALRPNGVQTALGRVTLRDLTALSVDQRSQPGNVELLGRFKPDLPVPTPGDPINHFIELRPRASGGLSTWGRWSVKPTTLPSFAAEAEFTWTWEVSAGDLDAVERRHVGKRVIEIRLTVEGLAALDGQVLPVWGQVDLRMFRTEWEDKILTPLKRPLPPSWEQLLPDAQRAEDPNWKRAGEQLDRARVLLRAGEGRQALGEALDAFQAVLSKPYSRQRWEEHLTAVPEALLPPQKRDGLAQMLGGFCMYLNLVGHHRGQDDPEEGAQPPMPVDQWEAEEAIAASTFLLALALRLSSSRA
jgi:hypothetical protein